MIKLGDKLSAERQRKGLTIPEVARATKIRPEFIIAIEKGQYNKLPSSTYAQGFVKNYIEYLGLSSRDLLALFRREFDEREYLGVLPESFVKKGDIPINPSKWKGRVLILVGFILLVGVFLFFQYKAAIFGPYLSINYPPDLVSIKTQDILVKGSTDPNSTVMVNNLPVFVDSNGHFTKDISVFPGATTITITSTNAFGKTSSIERHVTVQAE